MAITSIGYDGTIDEAEVERWFGYSTAAKFGVSGTNHFAASSVAGQVLQVKLAGGDTATPAVAWTAGLVDTMVGDATVQLNPVSSGVRWDMIVLRRNYQPPGGQTTIEVIQGGSGMSLPERNTAGGVLEDQPLWLVKVTAGQSIPTQYVDLRVWARNGGCTANHDLVRTYMGANGTMIEINGRLWIRTQTSGSPAWLELASPTTIIDLRRTGDGFSTHGRAKIIDHGSQGKQVEIYLSIAPTATIDGGHVPSHFIRLPVTLDAATRGQIGGGRTSVVVTAGIARNDSLGGSYQDAEDPLQFGINTETGAMYYVTMRANFIWSAYRYATVNATYWLES